MTGTTSVNGWASAPSSSGTAYIRYDFGSSVVIAGYAMTSTTGNADQQASGWVWQGSNDATTWTTLDTRSGYSWSGSQTRTFNIGNTAAYRYYELASMTLTSSYGYVQLGIFQLLGPGATVSGPVDVRHASLNSADTNCFVAECGDGSGGDLTTKTTFTNNYSARVIAVVSVRV